MKHDSDNDAKFDHNGIHLIYEKWPEHFREAAKIKCSIEHDDSFYNSLILCGMGGSATSCDILNDVMHVYGKIPSNVLRGQNMPKFVNKRTLVFVNSVSGNTEETLMMMKAAATKGAEIVCISAGGILADMAVKYGAQHVRIPNLSVPRASLPFLIIPGLSLIEPLLAESVKEQTMSIPNTLDRVKETISMDVPIERNPAKQISRFFENGLAFCFTSPLLYSVGKRFKNSLNENAKLYCLKESLLESSHNGIVPFTFNHNIECKVLFVKWNGDEKIVNDRFDTIKQLFQEIGQPVMDLRRPDDSFITASLSSLYILDYASIYLALLRKLDPAPTPAIDILKKIEKGPHLKSSNYA